MMTDPSGTPFNRLIMRLPGAVLDLMIPPNCCVCQTPLNEFRDDEWIQSNPAAVSKSICVSCSEQLPIPSSDICRICGAPSGPFVNTETGCEYCRRSQLAFRGVVSLGVYATGLQRFCQQGKELSGQPLVAFLTDRLFAEHEQQLRDWNCDLIVAVPMHWQTRLSRRIHPSETLARVLSEHLQIPVSRRILKQSRRLPQQSTLPPSQRRKNVIGAYRSRGPSNRLSGKTILLVDDILTTGATASACSQELRKAGAKQVHVAVLARGLGR